MTAAGAVAKSFGPAAAKAYCGEMKVSFTRAAARAICSPVAAA